MAQNFLEVTTATKPLDEIGLENPKQNKYDKSTFIYIIFILKKNEKISKGAGSKEWENT